MEHEERDGADATEQDDGGDDVDDEESAVHGDVVYPVERGRAARPSAPGGIS